jgi:mono/diheme cytochrome c family protein
MPMRALILIICGLALVSVTRAQSGEYPKREEARVASRSGSDIVPLPSIKVLTPAAAAGKKMFVQRCSICHLPALPSYTAYGPLLDGNLVADRGDDATRRQIMQGSARMPGFQYTLSPLEIDQIVGYLKTLDFSKKD